MENSVNETSFALSCLKRSQAKCIEYLYFILQAVGMS